MKGAGIYDSTLLSCFDELVPKLTNFLCIKIGINKV